LARKILLADDSVTAQNMGRRILTDAGYEVITVNNGSAALKKIAEQKPDLVVLDVYMPGYGGLEVCQRIKDTKETARIPVLLTVGKLEPFKPEEARRVHADGFIVKPFDVTELLAALTKLEDKIIPQPEAYKPGRFAKAIAAVENSDPGERFGNAETGWKNRIIIPSPGARTEESEPVPHVTSTGTAFRDLGRGEDFKPAEVKSGFERPIPLGLPPDITAEEIAAITAAAAAFEKPIAQTGTVTQESKVEPAAQLETPKPEFSAAQAGSEETGGVVQSSRQERRKGERRERREATSENTYGSNPIVTPESRPEVSASTHEVASVAPTDQPGNNFEEAKQQQADQPAASPDAEVAAALAFLAPAKLEGEATNTSQESQVEQEHWASYGSTGPRWVAEPIPVAETEATLPLDREVEKTHAAFAAVLANVDVRPEAVSDSVAPLEGLQNNSIQEPVSAAAETAAAAEATPNIQPDALFYSAPIAEIKESTFVSGTTPTDTTPTEREDLASTPREEGEAAYAAAASAGTSGTEPENNKEMKLLPATSENSSDAGTPEPGDRQRESEMAAAWANWKHIRESIVGSDSTSHVEDANAGYRDSGKEDPPSSPMSNEDAASSEDASSSEPVQTEASEIASIVDTMLAELKPKLMEEIAKKMDTEKKGKKKKKE
jgi:CheY-like chemotaxis protein